MIKMEVELLLSGLDEVYECEECEDLYLDGKCMLVSMGSGDKFHHWKNPV